MRNGSAAKTCHERPVRKTSRDISRKTILAMKAGLVQQPEEVEQMNGKAVASRIRPEETMAREQTMFRAIALAGVGLLAVLARKSPEAREALRPGNLLAIGRIFVHRGHA